MYDRIEWDYKNKLKRYLRQNYNKLEVDFLIQEIKALENTIFNKERVTDRQIDDEIIRDLPKNYEIAKRENQENDFLQITRKDRRKNLDNEIKDLKNTLFEYQIKLDRFKPLSNSESILDFSDSKGTEKIIMLEKLGILKFLREQEPFIRSTNSLASAISGFTGIKANTAQSYINPMNNPTAIQKNNPLNKEKNVNKVIQKLTSLGFKQSDNTN